MWSSTDTSQWLFNVSTSQSVSYINVRDSDATGSYAPIDASTGGISTGSFNVNWTWPSVGINISGGSDMRTGDTVTVAVNNTPYPAKTGTISAVDGTWTITSVTVGANAIVTVWVVTATAGNQSTAVTKYDNTGPITGMVLNQNVLSIGSADNASLTVTNLGQYDWNNDTKIMHTANSGVLTVDGGGQYTNEKIDILSGNTFTINGGASESLTTINIDINGALVSTGAGAINVSGNWTNSGTFTAGSSTVTYNAAAGGQTIGGVTYNNLTLSNTSGTNTAGGNLVVNGTLDTAAGGTLDMTASYTLSGTLGTITNNGTISTAVPTTTSAVPIPSGKSWGGTIIYAAATGAQTIVAGTYNNLTLSNTSGTNTAGGNLVVNVTLTTTNGGTLDMVTYDLGVTNVTNAGTIKTQSTSATPLTTCKTWGGTVQYDRAGIQGIAVGTYNNLTLAGTSAKTFQVGTTTVNGILSMEGTATAALTGTLTYGAAATLQYNTATGRTAGAAEWITPFTATGGIIIANTGAITLNADKVLNASVPLTINSGAALSSGNYALTIGGDWTNNGGAFTPGTGTVTFNGTGAQAINGTASSQAFYNIIIAKTAGQTLSVSGSTTTLTVQDLTET